MVFYDGFDDCGVVVVGILNNFTNSEKNLCNNYTFHS